MEEHQVYNRSVRPHARLAQTASAQDENFRVLFESASDAIFVGLPDGTLTAVNPAGCVSRVRFMLPVP